ncbi:hypothetical protein [Glaciecola sp. 1036]|uniref:hypothetical protein n=1 Tax=Alteromonadaceae TaxID=72275 RepID=UPI003D089994
MASPKFHNSIRKYHRWIGFFLAGIMSVYAISGTLLIFRTTDFLKFEQTSVRQIETNLNANSLGEQLRIRGFRVIEEDDQTIRFANGEYNKQTGEARVTSKEYPIVLDKLVKLHKATTNSPIYYVNIAFGACLLFFSISAFLMFLPRAAPYKNGLKIAGAGIVFMLCVVFFAS